MKKAKDPWKGKEEFSPYITLDYLMLESAAWKCLSNNARAIYPYWKAQFKKSTGFKRLIPTGSPNEMDDGFGPHHSGE